MTLLLWFQVMKDCGYLKTIFLFLLQPLNPDPCSTWHRYFEDNELLLQIDHDTRRLYPDMSFFQHPTPYPQTEFNTGTLMNIGALKKRVDKSILPSKQITTSRGGIKNVSQLSCCLKPCLSLSSTSRGYYRNLCFSGLFSASFC